MKKLSVSVVTFAGVLALAAAAWAAKPADAEKPASSPASVVYDADSAFEFLKTLAGDWDRDSSGHQHGSKAHGTTFRVSAAGSAVVETIFPGQKSEMITVYHRNGKDLLLTHYCALWNAPVMKFEKTDKPGEIKFAFEGGTNFDPAVDTHVHEGAFLIKDANTIEATFVSFANGKANPGGRSVLKRKSAESSVTQKN